MVYKVKISNSAEKFISKLDGSYKKKIVNFIEYLENNPVPKNKKHILDVSGNSFLCEYSLDKLRFYYTIENLFIVIEDIEYDGEIEVLKGFSNHKSGNKNYPNQKRDIKSLLKKLKEKIIFYK